MPEWYIIEVTSLGRRKPEGFGDQMKQFREKISREQKKQMRVLRRQYRKNRPLKEKIGSVLYLAPSLLGVLLFFVLPFFVVIYYSVVDNPITHNFVFLDNFSKVLNNAAFRVAARNTGMFSLIAVPAAVILSMLLAIMLAFPAKLVVAPASTLV